MTEETLSPEAQERAAISRIALTGDGLLLHRYLRRVLESRRATDMSGALSRHEGARILAGDLMAVMAEGIENNRGRSDTDNPILTGTSRAVSVARSGGARRRGTDAPGWGPEPDDTGEA